MAIDRKAQRPAAPDRDANPIVPWLHGLAAIGDERWLEAIPALQRFIEMVGKSEDRVLAYRNLSACYLALERFDEALAALDEVRRLGAEDADIAHGRAIIDACAGRPRAAIATAEDLLRRWPRQAKRLQVRDMLEELRRIQKGERPPGDYLVGHLNEQIKHDIDLGDFTTVEVKARRMIAANANAARGHFLLGVACLAQRRSAEALAALQAAYALDPGNEPTLYNIGHAYLQMDEPAQALPWLERALGEEPRKTATLHQLGVACERLGRRNEAVAWWRRALKVDPQHYLAQQRLHEVGAGPEPVEPPLPPVYDQLRTMTPLVKARMRLPRVYRNGGVTLTYESEIGFVLEDTENPRNGTIHAGGPFQVAYIQDEDLLDLIGLVKLLLRMINRENTRDVAVLAYYAERPIFAFEARYERGKEVAFNADGRFVVTEAPRFFKLRMDSDLATPYGEPMQGTLIYLNQQPQPGLLVSTMRLAGTSLGS